MNENSINQNAENRTTRKMETKQDVQIVQEELQEKKEQIIDESPKLNLSIKQAPFLLDVLFEKDGTPKGDFRVSERYRKKVFYAFKHPRTKSSTGETYYGELSQGDYYSGNYSPNEYLIIATPTFLTDDELQELQIRKQITKRINNVDITLIAPVLQKSDYSARVERYRKEIEPSRKKIQEISGIMTELENLKAKLPMGTREVIIESNDELNTSPGFPRR